MRGVWRIVPVDLRRLRVGMPHPLLDRTERRASGSHLRAERMPQFVKGDAPNARRRQRCAEPLPDLRRIEDVPGLRMAEHEILVGPVRGPLEMML